MESYIKTVSTYMVYKTDILRDHWHLYKTQGKNEFLYRSVCTLGRGQVVARLVFLMLSRFGGRILCSLSRGSCIFSKVVLHCKCLLSDSIGMVACCSASLYCNPGYAILRALSCMCSIASLCSSVSPPCQTGEAYSRIGRILAQ